MQNLKVRSGVEHVARKSSFPDDKPATVRLHVQVEDGAGRLKAKFVLDANELAVLLAGGSVDIVSEV